MRDPELEPAEALRAEQEAELEADAELEAGAELEAKAERDAEAEGPPVAEAVVDAAADPGTDLDQPELTIAFSPRQILGGFALLAALLILLVRRRKSGKG